MKINQYWIPTNTTESEKGTPVYKGNGVEEVSGFVHEAQEGRVQIVLFDEVESTDLPPMAFDLNSVDSMEVFKSDLDGMSIEAKEWLINDEGCSLQACAL